LTFDAACYACYASLSCWRTDAERASASLKRLYHMDRIIRWMMVRLISSNSGPSGLWILYNSRKLLGVSNLVSFAPSDRRSGAVWYFGHGCILRSGVAVETLDTNELRDARTCLEATLLAGPNDPDINAELAIVLLASEQAEVLTEATSRALALANNAVLLAPMSDRAGYAYMLALFRNGQTEASFVSGYRAMALNPNNGVIPARLSAMLFANGRWAEGKSLAIKASLIDKNPHNCAGLTLALDAYRRGEFAEALLRVQQMGRSDNYVANILELAASGQLENADGMKEAANRLKARSEDFWTSFASDMTARQYTPELIDRLGRGLIKASLALPALMTAASSK
jgi:hypothetical protein